MACQKERGAALIIVLFFCIITAMVILESSALQVKMLNHYRAKMHTDSQIEKRLLALESKLKTNKKESLPEEIHFCQFVPDTLLLGEKEGIDYYRIQVEAVVTTFATRHVADPTFTPFIKLSYGEEGIITTSFFSDKESKIAITDRSGKLIRTFTLSINSTPLSEWAVVDSDGNGTADFIYLGNEKGHLWKINVQSHLPEEWDVYLTLLEGKIKGRILAGAHPQGDGLLIYVWGEQGIYALWDKAPNVKIGPFPYFKIEENNSDQPLLRQGYLIIPTRRGETKIVDAFSGKSASQEAFLERLGRKTWRTMA